jgi:hypothetical protein
MSKHSITCDTLKEMFADDLSNRRIGKPTATAKPQWAPSFTNLLKASAPLVRAALLVRQVLKDLHDLVHVLAGSRRCLLTLLPELLASPGVLHALTKRTLSRHQSI